MPIDQAFLDGLTDIPRVGEDGVNAPAEGEEKPAAPAAEAGGGTNGGGPKTEPAATEPAKTDGEATEEDAYQLLESLFDEVKPAAQPAKATEVKEAPKEVAKPVETSGELKLDLSFFPKTDEEYDSIIASRSSFLTFQNKLLEASQAYYEAKIKGILDQLPTVQTKAVEEAMRRAAEFVPQNVQAQLSLQKMVDKFYEDNPSLLPIRKVVGQVANKLSAAHPDWSYEQVFAETAKQANRVVGMLNLPQTEKTANGGPKKPAFAKVSTGGRKPAKELTGIQKDIDMLIS